MAQPASKRLVTEAALTDPATSAGAALKSTFALKGEAAAQVAYLNAYDDFFGGSSNDFVAGQTVANTTTTAAVAVGATVLPVASASGLSAGVVLVVNVGTANQQLLAVSSVAGTDVTVTPALKGSLASGATVAPLWTNSNHLTTTGYDAIAYWLAQHPKLPQIASGKVTLLGNSWFDGKTQWATRLNERFPAATVVNVGISGNTSTAMLARFDTDVPADSKYVLINEPSVNDTINLDGATSAANLLKLIGKIRAIGAVPIVLGPVPLSDNINPAQARAALIASVVAGDVVTALNPDAGSGNTRVGGNAQRQVPTGQNNTAVGKNVHLVLTTGTGNTGVGMGAQDALTSGSGNVAVGQDAQGAATTAFDCTIVGAQAGLNLTASDAVMLGRSAGYGPGGVIANATTTGSGQVLIGRETGQPNATQVNRTVAIGYRALAGGGHYAVAIGSTASANGWGAVALGTDSTGAGAAATANDEFVLGTAKHTVKVKGRLNVAPQTPASSADTQGQTGDITADDNYIYVKTSTGWKRAALTAF